MKAQRIDGKAVAADIRKEVRQEVVKWQTATGKTPGLAVILVGDHPASEVYVRNKGRACEEAGIRTITVKRPADISENDLLAEIGKINADPAYNGILVQLPLPGHIDSQKVIEAVHPLKDVDCFHPYNVGRLVIGMSVFEPCTPAGIVALLKRYDIDPAGKHAVILGRSNIVGKPLANLLVQKSKGGNAVVTVVHSRARNIPAITRQADILVAAMGVPEFVTADMVREGAVVIDVGINRVETDTPRGYKLVGDVAFEEVSEIAGYITPVPGGVGPMTIALLLKNTLRAFCLQNELA